MNITRDSNPDCSFRHAAQQETEKLKPAQKSLCHCEKLPQLFYFFFQKKKSYFLVPVSHASQLFLMNLYSQTEISTTLWYKKSPTTAQQSENGIAFAVAHVPQLRSLNALHTHATVPSPSPDCLAHACPWEHLHLCFMPQFYSPCAPVRQKSLIKWKC